MDLRSSRNGDRVNRVDYNGGMMMNATTNPIMQSLRDALYALNRVIGAIDAEQLLPIDRWSDLERDHYNKLIESRDHIWLMMTTMDPTIHD